MNKIARCPACSAEFTEKELEDADECPECSTKSLPMRISDDVKLDINWHELRVLTNWAAFYSKNLPAHSRYTLASIVARLQKQFPDKLPLTLTGELTELEDYFPNAKTLDEYGNTVDSKTTIH